MPKRLATLGAWGRDLLGRMIGHRPFERPWMLDYLDRSLTVDASATRAKLGWEPTPHFHVLRRTLFLIENMRSNPQEWTLKNEPGLMRQPARASLAIHNAMVEAKEANFDAIAAYLGSPVRQDRFPHFQSMSASELRWYARIVYELPLAAVRTGDRALLLVYLQHLARRRFVAGFPPSEVCEALLSIDKIIVEQLMLRPEMQPFKDQARESLSLSTAVAIDGVQDAFDAFVAAGVESSSRAEALSTSGEEIERLVDELNAFYRSPIEESRSQVAD